MGQYTTNEFRKGLKVLVNEKPYEIIENEFIKPGKGQAFNRVKLRQLGTSGSTNVLEKTFKSGQSLPKADVVEQNMEYLYEDTNYCYFMDPKNFEQMSITKTVVGEAQRWLKAQDISIITLYSGQAIAVQAPNFVTLTVTQTDPGLKGDTAQGGSKLATLETGAQVRVPLFIGIGALIRIDTRTARYVSRISKDKE